ncbi:MAG TPA: nucleotidyltransferase domain-containing protein [Candidatus Acidoferrum sp.]|nr:nucleotidyltransferase domain-containing protein [Candidatus Acidoferrum sp.]
MLDLRSKARRKLLAYFFANPAARLHLRGLAQQLGVDPSNLSKELARLERQGLFLADVIGRQKYFELNRKYPLYKEIRSIVEKTIGVVPLLTDALKGVPGIDKAYLYGSFARRQEDAASDIDVLVIGKPPGQILAVAIRKLERQLGREINYTVLAAQEFEARQSQKDAFLANIWHNKHVSLIEPHEQAQTARHQLGANRSFSRQRR